MQVEKAMKNERIEKAIKAVMLVLFVLQSAALAQVRVLPTEIKDERAPASAFGGLEIELKVFGDILSDAKAIRLKVDTATDETGKSIIKERQEQSDFDELSESDQNVAKVTLKLSNPARQAATIREITGYFEFFSPSKDPASTVTVSNITKAVGSPVNSPALKAAGIEVTLWSKAQFDAKKKIEEEKLKKAQAQAEKAKTEDEVAQALIQLFGSLFSSLANMDEEDIALQIKDPQSKIVSIEFQGAGGNAISSGRMSMGGRAEQTRVYDFKEKLPAGAVMKIYILTAKAVVKAPFRLENIPLP